MNPEHAETLESIFNTIPFLDKVGDHYNMPKEQVLQAMKRFAQLAVKEAREQDIKEMEEWKAREPQQQGLIYNRAIEDCISIVKSKL
jgi:hypothetical protein